MATMSSIGRKATSEIPTYYSTDISGNLCEKGTDSRGSAMPILAVYAENKNLGELILHANLGRAILANHSDPAAIAALINAARSGLYR